MSFKSIDDRYVAATYKRFPLELVRGEGSLLYDAAGRRYIDMGSGIGGTAFGHADAAWISAVTAQLSAVAHTSNLYYTEPCARLAEVLCTRTGMARVFFANSGAEANECAIKVARRHAADVRGLDNAVIVTLKNSFHGRTLTTLAATGQDHFHKLFQPLTPGFIHAEAENIEEMQRILDEYPVAAVLLECVQGEGGVNALSGGYLTAVERAVHERGALFMIDEVQTGNGRTGELYAYQHYGLHPDVVTTAKGLGGGLPIGACLMAEGVSGLLGYGDHGSTFGGNPVAAAGALSVLSRIDDALLASVREKSARIFSALSGAKGIKSVSGLGLMIGIETVRPAAEVVADGIAAGVLCLTAKNKVRLLPALNIDDAVLDEAIAAILAAAAKGVEA